MQIKELALATGVDIETIRYYEKQGLLPAPPRRDNGYRSYEAEHVQRLSFIRHCRALDMPLADVNRLLGFFGQARRALRRCGRSCGRSTGPRTRQAQEHAGAREAVATASLTLLGQWRGRALRDS